MITSFTEVIFIDEASESTLDIGDWKVLTQGGYSAHDVKYQTAKAILNKCPMIIISCISCSLVQHTNQLWRNDCALMCSKLFQILRRTPQHG